MNLQSEISIVNKSTEELYLFLTNMENFKKILPDGFSGVEIFDDAIKFSMSGFPPLKLIYSQKIPNEKIQLKAENDTFPIFLTCNIKKLNELQSETQLLLDGEINMMIAMMIKKPLQNLLDTLAEKLKRL